MTKRTYTQKDGTVWEWEETAELSKFIKKLHTKEPIPPTRPNNAVV
jgi:hypothetical protein